VCVCVELQLRDGVGGVVFELEVAHQLLHLLLGKRHIQFSQASLDVFLLYLTAVGSQNFCYEKSLGSRQLGQDVDCEESRKLDSEVARLPVLGQGSDGVENVLDGYSDLGAVHRLKPFSYVVSDGAYFLLLQHRFVLNQTGNGFPRSENLSSRIVDDGIGYSLAENFIHEEDPRVGVIYEEIVRHGLVDHQLLHQGQGRVIRKGRLGRGRVF
jgi:hypothetical protein